MDLIHKQSEKEELSNLIIEQGILSSLLLDNASHTIVASLIRTEDFFHKVNQEIYQSLLDLINKNLAIDAKLLMDYLKKKRPEFLDSYLDLENYILDLLTNPPLPEDILEEYCIKLQDYGMRRSLLHFLGEANSLPFNFNLGPKELGNHLEQTIFSITQRNHFGYYINAKHVLREVVTEIEHKMKNQGQIHGIASGFHHLDQITDGFQNSDLIILAARPGMGKTAFALNMISNISIPKNSESQIHSALFVSLEMSEKQLIQRLISSEGRIDSHILRSGKISRSSFPNILKIVENMQKGKLFISEGAALNYYDIRAMARRLKSQENLKIIIIDYLQLLKHPNMRIQDNRQNEVAEISRNLKIMARELDVPVIALSQLSREVEKRSSKIPILSDLRDSGAIEQDADLILFLHRQDYFKESKDQDHQDENISLAKLIIAKHRNGPSGEVELTFNKKWTRFENINHDYDE